MLKFKDFQDFQGACERCDIQQISRTSYVLTFHMQISHYFGSRGNTLFFLFNNIYLITTLLMTILTLTWREKIRCYCIYNYLNLKMFYKFDY